MSTRSRRRANPLLTVDGFRRDPQRLIHDRRIAKSFWYYEDRRGLEIYVETPPGVMSATIPWRKVAAYMRRKEKTR